MGSAKDASEEIPSSSPKTPNNSPQKLPKKILVEFPDEDVEAAMLIMSDRRRESLLLKSSIRSNSIRQIPPPLLNPEDKVYFEFDRDKDTCSGCCFPRLFPPAKRPSMVDTSLGHMSCVSAVTVDLMDKSSSSRSSFDFEFIG